jgi:hypothetical protein
VVALTEREELRGNRHEAVSGDHGQQTNAGLQNRMYFHWSGRSEREGSRRVSVPQPVPSLFELEKWVS